MKMSAEIQFNKVSEDTNLEAIGSQFCDEHGDDENGIIPDEEYDKLFDHLGAVISKYASYSGDGDDAAFSGYRYVDQIPWITIVAEDDADPAIALKAALEAVQTAHRPLAVSFDYYPDELMILPPNIVYSTFEQKRLNQTG